MAKVASVAEAMRKEVARERKGGPTVAVRAIKRGFYGYPLADTRDPGQEFRMRVSDLKPYQKGGRYYTGEAVRMIEHDGKQYALPTWCEDARQPSSLLADTEEDDELIEEPEDVL